MSVAGKHRLPFRNGIIFLALALTLNGFMVRPAAAIELSEASKAVVKILVTRQEWDMDQPWTKDPTVKLVCTGFFIPQGILTSAHCVADATYIRVEWPGLNDRLDAKILAVNHQVDLALIDLIDDSRRPDVKPITFDALPELRDKVVTVGYPIGGRQVSYTEGVVSRIDIMNYAHSNIASLMVQTDAAINSGNSGGPVFSNQSGASLGVATQRARTGEGLGYFIPAPVVNQFLDDIKDGKVDGIPTIGVFMQGLDNPAYRGSLKMTDDESGVRVMVIAKDSSADGVLKPDDVLLKIDGVNILNDGQVPFRGDGKISLGYYVTTHQVGDTLDLTILRDGKVRDVHLTLKPYKVRLVPTMPLYDTKPRYYEIGGVVFMPVEKRYTDSLGNRVPISIREQMDAVYGETKGLEELIVISRVFDATVNKGYSGLVENVRVSKINGRTINRLEDVVKAFNDGKKRKYHIIEFVNHTRMVLDAAEVAREENTIRQRYNIREM